jgi:hypothetical protein
VYLGPQALQELQAHGVIRLLWTLVLQQQAHVVVYFGNALSLVVGQDTFAANELFILMLTSSNVEQLF